MVVKGKYGEFAEFVIPFPAVEEIRQTIARSIGQARRKKGLSQTALAKEIGKRTGREMDPSQVSDWETGKNLPRLDMLVALAAALEVSVDQLITGEEHGPEAKRMTEFEQRLDQLTASVRDLVRRIDQELGSR